MYNFTFDEYRSFLSTEDISAAQLKGDLSRGKFDPNQLDQNYLKQFLRLLFPRTSGAFISSKSFWEKFKELGENKNNNANASPKLLAKLARIYYYHPSNESFENEIFEWYKNPEKGGRPSAYKYPTIANIKKTGKTTFSKSYSLGTSIREMLPSFGNDSPSNAELLMVLIDSPGIDLKLRDADKVEFFANYMPTLMASSMIPFLDVKFIDKRLKSDDKPALNSMSQLKFLLGPDQSSLDDEKSPNRLMYDGLKYQLSKITKDRIPRPQAKPLNDIKSVEQTMVGMELFTMPQTLLNMDYDQQANPRYNPVINPTVPFGAISSVSINVMPSKGLMSFKTANLTLKIFDRSRLVEIAEFLNPKLYSASTIILTYGWRAPIQATASGQTPNSSSENEYFNFINNNLLKTETYGIQNSSITIDNSGTATVSLQLFTKGVPELKDITPNGASISFDRKQSEFADTLYNLRKLAEDLNLTSLISGVAKDIRGTQVIAAASQGSIPDVSFDELTQQMKAIERNLRSNNVNGANAKIDEFIETLNRAYSATTQGTEKKLVYKRQEELEKLAKQIIQDRLSTLKTQKVDFFAHVPTVNKQTSVPNSDDPLLVESNHPLMNLPAAVQNPKFNFYDNGGYGAFGNISFGKLFLTYFSSAFPGLTAPDGPINDEYQVFFYNLNRNAGKMGNLNIAEFPVDMKSFEDAYTKRVIEQKGEHMTLVNFLEIVRSSQFDNLQHPAYGFSRFNTKKGDRVPPAGFQPGTTSNKNKKAEPDPDAQLLNALVTANANTTGEPFVQPTIDFYVESGLETQNVNQTYDLLLSFEKSAAYRSQGFTKGGKRIVRIHIFDKAATPHQLVEDIFLSADKGGYIRRTKPYKNMPQVYNQKLTAKQRKEAVERTNRQVEILNTPGQFTTLGQAKMTVQQVNEESAIAGDPTRYEYITFKDANGKPSFELVKREVSRFIPTLLIGAQGSTITDVSYGSGQDAQLATVLMMKNRYDQKDPTQPNGAGMGDLPLQVIPGQLQITMLGCPVADYMQQFFIDLGTGTSVDSTYNITGLTHTLSPGKFTTQLKLTFTNAYGKYEGAKALEKTAEAVIKDIKRKSNTRKGKGPQRRFDGVYDDKNENVLPLTPEMQQVVADVSAKNNG